MVNLLDGSATFHVPNVGDLSGDWKNDAFIAGKSYLGNPVFLNALLCGGPFFKEVISIRIFLDYFRDKPKYAAVVKAFESFFQNSDPSENLLQKLLQMTTPQTSPQIIPVHTAGHSVLFSVKPGETDETLALEISNSGEGLEYHKKDETNPHRYQTTLRIEVPKSSIDLETIQDWLKQYDSVFSFYKILLNLKDAKVEQTDNPLQQEQNCSKKKVDLSSFDSLIGAIDSKLEKMDEENHRLNTFLDLSLAKASKRLAKIKKHYKDRPIDSP